MFPLVLGRKCKFIRNRATPIPLQAATVLPPGREYHLVGMLKKNLPREAQPVFLIPIPADSTCPRALDGALWKQFSECREDWEGGVNEFAGLEFLNCN